MAIQLPIKFKEKVTLPPSPDGTGYPFRISSSDLDQNFAYSSLDADESWIEFVSVGEHSGRKLKLPPLPSGDGTFFLTFNNTSLDWSQYEEKEVSICENNTEATGVVLFRQTS